MWVTYIPNMRLVQASLLEISCLQAGRHKHTHTHTRPHDCKGYDYHRNQKLIIQIKTSKGSGRCSPLPLVQTLTDGFECFLTQSEQFIIHPLNSLNKCCNLLFDPPTSWEGGGGPGEKPGTSEMGIMSRDPPSG